MLESEREVIKELKNDKFDKKIEAKNLENQERLTARRSFSRISPQCASYRYQTPFFATVSISSSSSLVRLPSFLVSFLFSEMKTSCC